MHDRAFYCRIIGEGRRRKAFASGASLSHHQLVKTSILLITVSGDDRPGIVGQIAAIVHDHGGNWERSRLIHLSGRFVGLLQVRVPDSSGDELRAALTAVKGLETTVALGHDRDAHGPSGYSLTLLGADHGGIVREIFEALSRLGLNVESLSTRTEAAADSGTLLFRAEALLSSPDPLPVETIRETIEALAHDLHVDIVGA